MRCLIWGAFVVIGVLSVTPVMVKNNGVFIGDPTGTNPLFVDRTPVLQQLMRGVVYRPVYAQSLPANAGNMPYRVGDRQPSNPNYYRLDPTTYPSELIKIEMTGSRVLKFFSRGVIASGASFRFTTNDAEETAFINACGARGLRVIASVWFDPAIDFSIAARRTDAATAMQQLVQAHKGNNNILAWGFGDLATSLETTANLANLRQAYLAAARAAAAEENIPANPASPFGNCRARHPLVMTLGTDDLWGQLRYQPLVPGPTRRYVNFPGIMSTLWAAYVPPMQDVEPPVPNPGTPESCVWEEWRSTITLSNPFYNRYSLDTQGNGVLWGNLDRQALRFQSWNEPKLRVSCPDTVNAGAIC